MSKRRKKSKRGSNRNRREWIRKKKKERETYIQQFRTVVKKNNDSIWTPSRTILYKSMDTDSWFDIRESRAVRSTKHRTSKAFLKDKKTKSELLACKKIDLHLTIEQKAVVDRWMDTYIKMYNRTLKYLKTQFYKHRRASSGSKEHIQITISRPKKVKKPASKAVSR